MRLWGLDKRTARAVLTGHTEMVRDLALSPDGKLLASAGKDGVVRLWDVASGKPRGALKGHFGLVRALAFSPRGDWLASGGRDNTLRFWDVPAGREALVVRSEDPDFQALAWAPDGSALFSGGVNGKVVRRESPRPLSPEQALGRVGQAVVVEMLVRASKDRLERRKEIYLDSEKDFRDPKNLAAVITVKGAADLRAQGVASPAEHFLGKVVRVVGVVTLVEKRPRVVIDEARQIRAVEKPPRKK